MKKYKKSFDFSYAIGVYPTLELLATHPDKVTRVLISSRGERNSGLDRIKSICAEKRIKTEMADGLIAKIAESENCYAVGVFDKYQTKLEAGNHLVLVNPSDRGNLGTVVRTMLAFNIKNLVIIKPAVDIFDLKVIRASMGAIFKINFVYYDSFKAYQSEYHQNLYPFVIQTDNLLPNIKFSQPFSLVFGNEGAGLSKEYNSVGTPVKIPQSSEVDSLNLSAAVAIALYEAGRE
jgi:RNA methyltransferase, TrmH family